MFDYTKLFHSDVSKPVKLSDLVRIHASDRHCCQMRRNNKIGAKHINLASTISEKIAIKIFCLALERHLSCADPGIFVRGGGVQVNLTKKALTTFIYFLIFYLILFNSSAYFTEVKWLILKTIIFQGSRGGPTFSRGGGGGGGVQLLIPYRNPYN